MLVDLRSWSISHVSSHTFLLALPTPVNFLEPRLGSGIEGPRAPLGDWDTMCSLSYFLMKIDDIDPFGDHDKTDAQLDETG